MNREQDLCEGFHWCISRCQVSHALPDVNEEVRVNEEWVSSQYPKNSECERDAYERDGWSFFSTEESKGSCGDARDQRRTGRNLIVSVSGFDYNYNGGANNIWRSEGVAQRLCTKIQSMGFTIDKLVASKMGSKDKVVGCLSSKDERLEETVLRLNVFLQELLIIQVIRWFTYYFDLI